MQGNSIKITKFALRLLITGLVIGIRKHEREISFEHNSTWRDLWFSLRLKDSAWLLDLNDDTISTNRVR